MLNNLTQVPLNGRITCLLYVKELCDLHSQTLRS